MKKILFMFVFFAFSYSYSAEIIITIPDAVLPRVVDAVALEYDYDENKLRNETKGQFAKRMLIEDWVKRIVRNQEGKKAAEGARKSAESAADSEVNNRIN